MPRLRSDEKWKRIAGLVLIALSFYIFLAFTSFLFSWQEDQSVVQNMSWETVQEAHPEVAENWMGLLGAILSHFFVYKWFGVGSYLFIPLLLLIGLKWLFEVSIVPVKTMLYHITFWVLYLSVFNGLAFYGNYDFMGGAFGYFAQEWLRGIVGMAGTVLVLLVSLLLFLGVAFNVHLPQFVDWFGNFYSNFREKVAAIFPFLFSRKEPAVAQNADNFANEEVSAKDNEFSGEQENDSFKDGKEEYFEENQSTSRHDNSDEALAEEEKKDSNEEVLQHEQEWEVPEETPAAEKTQNQQNQDGEISLEVEHTSSKNDDQEQKKEEFTREAYDPSLELSQYEYPSLELLRTYEEQESGSITQEELEERKKLIIDTLKNYKIGIDKIKATVGPTVTLYEIIPAAGVRISKIRNLEDDIALSLSALGIRIIAPIPGRGTIGIEVPNTKPQMVSMRSVLASKTFQKSELNLPIAFGKNISNEVFVTDLTKMPHLLMAGATGQGKSVGINAILSSLLYKKHPSQVKFVLVDPKKVELSLYKNIEKHFLAKLPDDDEPIVTDTSKVVKSLNSLCTEMDHRYDLLKEAQVRNLAEYNKKFIERRLNPEKGHRYLPYIVLVIDELADLMMTAGKEVEAPIARLAQLARAIGIHLILATQRPSVNIITGVIKANFPARLAFRVTSKVDSRTILDAGGAEQLIGRGDMLLTVDGDLTRLQCAFVDTDEVEKITDFIGQQQAYPEPHILPEVKEDNKSAGGGGGDEEEEYDSLFEEAARMVVKHQHGSTSLLQRRLKLGYNRAGRLMDQLESAGIVGPSEGSKAREVLYSDEYALEQFLNEHNKSD